VRIGGLTAVVLALGVAFLGLVGNIELSRSGDAARHGSWSAAAADASRALTWAPFSAAPWQDLGEAEIAMGDDVRAQASLRRGLEISPNDWSLWFDLARASSGRAQLAALARARGLNPLSPEIREFLRELRAEQPVRLVA
jgi:predicted Zn-dependent protease